jgi:DNA-binding NarL/FixJ family response regulator
MSQIQRPKLPLTQRQQEIAELAGQGISNKEIAYRLNLTEGSVKQHLHNIYNRLGVRKRTELIGAWLAAAASDLQSFEDKNAARTALGGQRRLA